MPYLIVLGYVFRGGVKTVVLFFEKGTPTRMVWYYSLDPGRKMGKTNQLNDADMVEFIELQKTFADSPKSWSIDVTGIDHGSYDLSVKNPDCGEVVVQRRPLDIMEEISRRDGESAEKGGVDGSKPFQRKIQKYGIKIR